MDLNVKTINGWGGVKFVQSYGDSETPTKEAFFSQGIGNVSYKPEYITKETVSHKIINILLGFRLTIEIELMNVTLEESNQFLILYDMINAMKGDSQREIGIYPRYSETLNYGGDINGNDYHICSKIESDIKFEDISKIPIGQTIKLSFSSSELFEEIPKVFGSDDVAIMQFNGTDFEINGKTVLIRK